MKNYIKLLQYNKNHLKKSFLIEIYKLNKDVVLILPFK